jgi:hypothetical protein
LSNDANVPERYFAVFMMANTLSVIGEKPLPQCRSIEGSEPSAARGRNAAVWQKQKEFRMSWPLVFLIAIVLLFIDGPMPAGDVIGVVLLILRAVGVIPPKRGQLPPGE